MHAGWSCIRLNDGPNIKLVELFKFVGAGLSLICCLAIRGSTDGFLLLRDFSDGVSQPRGFRVSQYVVSVESSFLTNDMTYFNLFISYVDSGSLMG